MNQPSDFQLQYPLSPRKFWKKVISKFTFWLIVLIIVAILQVIFVSQLPDLEGIVTTVNIFLWVFYGIVVFSLFVYSWYIKVYIKRYYYDCGDQFITIKKGVFAPTEIHVQYQKIQDVYVDQDILDRIMGLYDVHIASATVTSGIEAHIDGVSFDVAENLKNIILNKIHTGGSSAGVQAVSISQQKPQANPIQFSQKISSETYPISGAWIISTVLGSFVYSLFFSVILFRFLILIDFIYWILLFGFIFFTHIVWKLIWKNNFYFEFTPDYILLRTGVISRSENHLPYKSIQNVLNNQSVLDRVLGLSTVTIQNAAQQFIQPGGGNIGAGSAIALVWQPKDKAEELNNILNDIVSKISPQNSSGQMGV